ncbi:DNA polymeras-like protein epsilon subunit B [Microthyrium microscopicum]|uniref:DNA polymerase epsilon subunit B n=1 Tax=Microthyrium microscopicum TaxID=703497 RepID=A0A6A6U0X9_9PEZI|nr:DNA polymeras-like protein epsilon subunit B [Microthyrium microscopicum]
MSRLDTQSSIPVPSSSIIPESPPSSPQRLSKPNASRAIFSPSKNRVKQLAFDLTLPSSSPAFATPQHPIKPIRTLPPLQAPSFKTASVLPINLPAATLRPTAVRLFNRKYNLTLQTPALLALANFIGKHCGSGWKNEGLADGVLEEVAKLWKKQSNASIVTDDGNALKSILKTIETCMSGGRIVAGKGLSRQSSFAFPEGASLEKGFLRPALPNADSFGMSRLDVGKDEDDEDGLKDPREWIKVIDAFEQPPLIYNTSKKHFDKSKTKPSFFPSPSHKTQLFTQRYHVVHQRILRNEGFQQQTMMGSKSDNPSDGSSANKITPISNLLGRSDSFHLLFGLLQVLPTGDLAISDLTGSIPIDIQHARPFPDASAAWFCPGMLLLMHGVYVEDGTGASEASLGSMGGIGATIGGKFLASLIAHPPCERRSTTLGIQDGPEAPLGAAFGWTDFLGLGSEKAMGQRMRALQNRILGPGAPHEGNSKVVIAAEVALDQPTTMSAIRALFAHYAAQPASAVPLAIVLMGNFITAPALTPVADASSIAYKESFNTLASVISDFPTVLSRTSLVFVPGDRDAWPSSFSAGGAPPVPRKPVPELFTSRIRRAVAEANRETRGRSKAGHEGDVVWTSNPSRLSWFGCAGEMVLFRDDITGRLRRSAIRFAKQTDDEMETDEGAMAEAGMDTQPMDVDGEEQPEEVQIDPDVAEARRLTKTICDQAYLAPFPLSTRPVYWDFGHAMQLYPLPSALVIADPEAPSFALNYMGTCVMNPGRLVGGRRGERASWLEFDILTKKGEVKTAQ